MPATLANPLEIAKALEPHVNAVLLAMAHARLEREKIDAMQTDILATAAYRRAADDPAAPGARILKASEAWLMSDTDFADYNAECQRRIRAMGYRLPAGHCPALVAEHLQLLAEVALLQACEAHIPEVNADTISRNLNKRCEFLDLTIRFVVNSPGYHKPTMAQATRRV